HPQNVARWRADHAERGRSFELAGDPYSWIASRCTHHKPDFVSRRIADCCARGRRDSKGVPRECAGFANRKCSSNRQAAAVTATLLQVTFEARDLWVAHASRVMV